MAILRVDAFTAIKKRLTQRDLTRILHCLNTHRESSMAGELPADKARRDTITRLLDSRDDEPRRAAELLPLLYEELRAFSAGADGS